MYRRRESSATDLSGRSAKVVQDRGVVNANALHDTILVQHALYDTANQSGQAAGASSGP